MNRRDFIGALTGLLAARAAAGAVTAGDASKLRIGAAWRGPSESGAYEVGALEVDWEAATTRVRYATVVPSRAHGLWAEADGGLLAVAARPGAWLLRFDPDGRVAQRVTVDDDGSAYTFDGHVVVGRDGRHVFTTETRGGAGRVGVRDAGSLRKIDEWPTHGVEPHQLLADAHGHLVVANGGIHRRADGAKRDLDRMDSSLVWLDGTTGAMRGQWRLPDRRLSMRHMAWNRAPGAPQPLLGLALQAEHDDPRARRQAPAFAVWDGRELSVPTLSAEAQGYAGDIAAAAGGGFVISNSRLNRALWWHPEKPGDFALAAKLRQAYALAAWGDAPSQGVVIAAARGIGRWHPNLPAAMVHWPQAMALDNHWVVLAAA
jgi:hypothetical protein